MLQLHCFSSLFHNEKKTSTLDYLVQAMGEKNIANLNLYTLNRRNHTTLVPKLFLKHAICGSRAVTDQISFDRKFGKPDLTQCGVNEMAVIQARTILTGF